MKYVAGFKSPERACVEVWWPHGTVEQCDEAEALRRYHLLLDHARRRVSVEGLLVEFAFVQRVDDGEVMLQGWPDGDVLGLWAPGMRRAS